MKRLSPNNCSVVVFQNGENELESTLQLLYKVFSDVNVKSTESQVISQLKQSNEKTSSTLLLIDAESCDTKTMDECPSLLLTVVDLLKEGFITNVVPIVYSSLDSPSYMVKCLQSGAADFVLKPLTEVVVKTLFLNVTRYRIQRTDLTLEKVEKTGCSIWDSQSMEDGQERHVWSKFKSRLKGVFLEENWISKLVAEYYTPKPSVRRSSMSSMLSDRKEYLKKQISCWDFLPLDLDMKDLIQVVFMILDHTLSSFEELKELRVPQGDLYHFIFDICNSYHSSNPYHNFRHAVDVLQANFYFLCKIGAIEPMYPDLMEQQQQSEDNMIKNLFEPIDIFALLMASIGHDVGHPGVNNNFMTSTSTPLAILYNDKSVLESFHAMSFFHLLKEHCFSRLTDLRAYPEYAIFRKIVVNSILATDMSMHDEYVQKISDQAERIKVHGIDFSDKLACEKEKILLCGALIKCADISNCARPFDSAKRWAVILSEEFFEQGDLEKELGMSVLPINERGKIRLEDFQLSFKKFVALKLFESISKVTSSMQFTVDSIKSNIQIWEDLKKRQICAAAATTTTIDEDNKLVSTPNTIPPQPTPDSSCTPSQRPRSGI
ncbi:hypothetical protein BD770DRAFT_394272 [Pilaira anomala]|nr:hypothetical protein BD770DRAFT_394272 [Pilaira anomala]